MPRSYIHVVGIAKALHYHCICTTLAMHAWDCMGTTAIGQTEVYKNENNSAFATMSYPPSIY